MAINEQICVFQWNYEGRFHCPAAYFTVKGTYRCLLVTMEITETFLGQYKFNVSSLSKDLF